MKHLLIIGYTWPESRTTAAGVRMMQLLNIFRKNNFQVTFVSSAARTEYSENLEELGINTETIQLNDPAFDVFLKALNPDVVLFDRFYTEEQFGWRVAENCPEVLRILDTEDLHFLRNAREQALKGKGDINDLLHSDITKRELASIYRSDISLLISETEVKLLKIRFKVDPALLHYIPFLVEESPSENSLPEFEEREHFIFIGNYKHKPNAEAVLFLKNKIWPELSQKLPKAELHCYGPYASEQIKNLHKPNERFFVKGWAEDAFATIKNAKVMLAPLQFGAGLKGKLIQAMQCGTPSVTTSIGAEGINDSLPWNGFITDEPNDFSFRAAQLYSDKDLWQHSQNNGLEVLKKRFVSVKFEDHLIQKINATITRLKTHRQENFIGSLLHHHTMHSTRFMSKWIEEKNKKGT